MKMLPLAAAADAAAEPIYLDPTFWVAVAFVIFVTFMAWKARSALIGGLDARAERIARDIAEAERLRGEAQALLEQHQAKQRAALSEAQAMLAQAEQEAQRVRARAESDLEQSLKRRERQALDRIAQAEAQAVADVRNLAVDLAITATRDILRQRIGDQKAAALADAAIAEVPRHLQ
jgi:F-type H+-transporting ATPase subunit b